MKNNDCFEKTPITLLNLDKTVYKTFDSVRACCNFLGVSGLSHLSSKFTNKGKLRVNTTISKRDNKRYIYTKTEFLNNK